MSRLTVPRILVLAELAAAGPAGRSGTELVSALQIRGNTIYPLLVRLRAEGLVTDGPPRPPGASGAPPRPLVLTGAGRDALHSAVRWAEAEYAAAAARATALRRALDRAVVAP